MYLWPKSQIHSTDLPKGKEKWAFLGHLSVWIEEKWGVPFFLNLIMKLRDLTSFLTSKKTSQKKWGEEQFEDLSQWSDLKHT